MTASPTPYENVWQYLRDVAIGLIAIVGGMFFAGAIAQPFDESFGVVYPVALCVGQLPFWWFTRRCGLHEVGVWGYAASCVVGVFVMSVAIALIPAEYLCFAFPAVIGLASIGCKQWGKSFSIFRALGKQEADTSIGPSDSH